MTIPMTNRGPSDELRFGDVTVTRVVEKALDTGMTPAELFPTLRPETWRTNREWLEPTFLLPGDEPFLEHSCRILVQSWLLRSNGRVILIDTGVGNAKERPYVRMWRRLETGFLDALAAAGVRPEDVDVVINTHLHPDHVGWNTRLEGQDWVPTFANAQYLMPSSDVQFWDPNSGVANKLGVAAQNVWEDSIAPVLDAGLVVQWSGSHQLDNQITLESAPGHTPGASIVRVSSHGEEAFFVGDTLHSPTQVMDPDVNSCFCENPTEAEATRRRIFDEASEREVPIFPAHFGGHGGFAVNKDGVTYGIAHWAPLAPV